MDRDPEMSEKDYRRLRRSQPKRERVIREAFGDPSQIGGFKGPWSGFVGVSEDRASPRDAREDHALRRIVNKHCLVAGKERSRSSYILSMGSPGLARVASKRFLVPRSNTMVFHDHKDMVSNVHLFRRHRLLLSSGFDGKVYLYNLKDGGLATTYMGHSQAVSSAALSADEHRFCTTSFDGFVKGWDVETGRCDARVGLPSPLTCQSAEALGRVVFAGALDGRIRSVDMRAKKAPSGLDGGEQGPKEGLFGPHSVRDVLAIEGEDVLVFTRRDGSLHHLDTRNGQVVKSIAGSYTFIELGHDQATLVVPAHDRITLLDRSTLEEKETIEAVGCSTRAKPSDSGDMLLYGDVEGIVHFVDCKSKRIVSLGAPSEMVTSVDWIDGSSSSVVSGDATGNAKVWE